jgi:proteasome lid subunit RPN8/RPN11
MKITDAQLKQIYAHAKETYPYECCGFLVGEFDNSGLVYEVHRATNQNRDRTDRFEISSQEYMQVEESADEKELVILGFYHSHPDYPPIPSQTDIKYARIWEGFYYLIVSVHEGMPLNSNVWYLTDDGLRRFVWDPLEIVDEEELK